MSAREDLQQVVTLLVDRPDEVVIEELSDDGVNTLELQVADDDLGKVIGRQGRTARALRRFLDARAASGGREWDLKILD